jgi:hypothetical protein
MLLGNQPTINCSRASFNAMNRPFGIILLNNKNDPPDFQVAKNGKNQLLLTGSHQNNALLLQLTKVG